MLAHLEQFVRHALVVFRRAVRKPVRPGLDENFIGTGS
jgi:hypothetical protein